MNYYLFITDDQETTELYVYETLDEAQDRIDELDPIYDFKLIEGMEI